MNPNERLCNKDPRNPMFQDLYGYEEEKPVPRENCACDNCFYGRDAMALEMIAMEGILRKFLQAGVRQSIDQDAHAAAYAETVKFLEA